MLCKNVDKALGLGKILFSHENDIGDFVFCFLAYSPSSKTESGISFFLNLFTKSNISSSPYDSFLLHHTPSAYLGISGGKPVKLK